MFKYWLLQSKIALKWRIVWLLEVEAQVCHKKAGMSVIMKVARTKGKKQAFVKPNDAR